MNVIPFTVHFRIKNCQTIPPETLNVFYILVKHTDNVQSIFVLIEVCQPGGAAINFSKIALDKNQTTLLLLKDLLLPLTSASKICLRCTILEL